MGILDEMLEGKKTIVILGHVNPDGDCIGSCLGLYNYLKENYEGLEVSVYLEKMGVKFSYLSGYGDVQTEYDDTKKFDLCITSDASDVPRLGAFAPYRETAKDTFCIDHHITNQGMCRVNVIESWASSASEVLFRLFDREKISKAVAECLYTGIAHDTGIFKFSNTVSLRTNSKVDVSRIAQSFGGGGHVKAAGCTMTGKPEEIVEKISEKIREQWKEFE